MEVHVNIKANKLTDEQKDVLVDALTDYVAEEGDANIARDLAVRIKKGVVMLFEYEPQLTPLKSQIYEYEGKIYALVPNNSDEDTDCDQCSLLEKCHNANDTICTLLAGENEAYDHYLKEIKDEDKK
jgi:hypothetical protein